MLSERIDNFITTAIKMLPCSYDSLSAFAEENECSIRIMMLDGIPQWGTLNKQPSRLDVSVVNHQVVYLFLNDFYEVNNERQVSNRNAD